jgi:hypothetical protein
VELERLTFTDRRRHSAGQELFAFEGVVPPSNAIEEGPQWSEDRCSSDVLA